MRDPVAFARALGDPTRWRVVHLVSGRALCVCELAAVLGLPQSTLSSHLRVIDGAGLLDCARRGKWLFYSVKPACLPLLRTLFRHFGSSAASDPALARDARKAAALVARRGPDCCPGPGARSPRARNAKPVIP